MSTGGAFVSSGTYGCVFAPPLKCTEVKKNALKYTQGNVGKLFTLKKTQEEELTEVKKIHLFDPNHLFTVPYVSNCVVSKKGFMPSDETSKCTSHVKPHNNTYYQMMYQNGGIDLSKLPGQQNTYPILFEDILRQCVPVFEGIVRMGEKQLTHADIKPPNVLIDLQKAPYKLHLIDFGMLMDFKDVKTQFHLHQHCYPYYPPEFQIFHCKRLNTAASRDPSIMGNICKKNFDYFGRDDFIDWISSQGMHYETELSSSVTHLIGLPLKTFITEFENVFVTKIDSYGIAMTLLELLFRLDGRGSTHVKNTAFVGECVTDVLFPMIHPDPYQRISIDEGEKRLKRVIRQFPNGNHTPATLTPAAMSSTSQANTAFYTIASPEKPSPMKKDACMKLKVVEIRQHLTQNNLPKYGNKGVMCDRLVDAMNKNYNQQKHAANILNKAIQVDSVSTGKKVVPHALIDQHYKKALADCKKTQDKGGYAVPELRKIAKALDLDHKIKRHEICDELIKRRA